MEIQKNSTEESVIPDVWSSLKKFTKARIALGRTGVAVPLKEMLDFRMSHAHARDAVYSILNTRQLKEAFMQLQLPVIVVNSKAKDRTDYLQNPDHGRCPDKDSAGRLKNEQVDGFDVVIIIADGLSATAINKHAVEVVKRLIQSFKNDNISMAPLVIAQQARVAIADEIGSILNAKLSLILIGERPGLSSPDSMGAYITYDPKPGKTDESRNCISNIRTDGLSYELAAEKISRVINASLQLKMSGIKLKDDNRLLNG